MNRQQRRQAERQRATNKNNTYSIGGEFKQTTYSPGNSSFDTSESTSNSPTYIPAPGEDQGFFDTSSNGQLPPSSQATWAGVADKLISRTSRTFVVWLVVTIVLNYFYRQSLQVYRAKVGYVQTFADIRRQWVALFPESLYISALWVIIIPLFSYFATRQLVRLRKKRGFLGGAGLIGLGAIVVLVLQALYLFFFGIPPFIQNVLQFFGHS